MQIKNIIDVLEAVAPPHLQESYDNAGLIVGNPETALSGVLFCLDSTEAIVEEARQKGCNLIVAHHPIVFRGLKRLNGATYIERTVMQAIRHNIAIYAIHTNLGRISWNGYWPRCCYRAMDWPKLSGINSPECENSVRFPGIL